MHLDPLFCFLLCFAEWVVRMSEFLWLSCLQMFFRTCQQMAKEASSSCYKWLTCSAVFCISCRLSPCYENTPRGLFCVFNDCSDQRFFLFRIQRMTTLLNEKEDSLRKLKETLRKSQQLGEESCKSAVCVCVVLFLLYETVVIHMPTLKKK